MQGYKWLHQGRGSMECNFTPQFTPPWTPPGGVQDAFFVFLKTLFFRGAGGVHGGVQEGCSCRGKFFTCTPSWGVHGGVHVALNLQG